MSKRTNITICASCGSAIPERAKYCPQCGARNQRPKKKKTLWILLSVLAAVPLLLFAIGLAGNDGPGYEPLDWNSVTLGNHAPEPGFQEAKVWDNSTDMFMADLTGLSEQDFNVYAAQCEQDGYTIERQKDRTMFRAFNEEGYNLVLNYYEDDRILYYMLSAPVQMGMLYWPSSGLGAMIPAPSSDQGKITADTNYAFNAYVGNMTTEDLDRYAQRCREAGFDRNYYKYDDIFSAEDEEGNMLNVSYMGNHVVSIDLYAAEE